MGFSSVGISGFGGVLPYARHMMVDKRRWVTDREFTELLSAGQLLPGPNIVNVSIILGQRFCGWRGAVAGPLGLMALPLLLFLVLAVTYRQFSDIAWVERMFRGTAAASAGLVIATAWKLLRAMPQAAWGYVLMLAAGLAVGWGRFPIPYVVMTLAPIGFVFVWLAERKSATNGASESTLNDAHENANSKPSGRSGA
jgi:chromate transporter